MAWRVLLALHSFGSATQQGVGVWDAESWQSAGSSFGSYGAYDPEDSGVEHRYYVHKGERIEYHPDQEEPLEAQGFPVPSEKACMDACDNDPRCECAAYRPKTRSCQRWNGCRRHPARFAKDSETFMLMKVPSAKPKYTEYRRYNTYGSLGSKDIDRGDRPAVVRSYIECQDRCTVDATCDCSVWAIDGTYRCWKHQGCEESTLAYDPVYTVFVKQKVFTQEDETTTEEVDPYLAAHRERQTSTTMEATTEAAVRTTVREETDKQDLTAAIKAKLSSSTLEHTTSTTPIRTTAAHTAAASTAAALTSAPLADASTTALPTSVVFAAAVPTTAAPTAAPANHSRMEIDIAMTMPFPADMGAQSIMRATKQLRQSRVEAVRELNGELEENATASVATAISMAAAFRVQEVNVKLKGIKGQVADDSLNITLKTEVSGVTDCSDKPELKASFLKKFSLAMKTIPPERLVRLRQLGSQLSLATVTGITCSEVSPHSDGLMAWASRWSRHTVIVLAAVICIATLCCCCSLFGHRGYQRVTGAPDTRTVRQGAAQPPRFESRSARMERVKSRVEKYSQRALDLVMAAEPDFEDTELQYYVKILNRCRGHAKSVCGSPWSEWQTSGDCELCKRRIDRPEKGLQCTQGGHRLCFRCMTSIMNWETLAAQEGQNSWTWAHKDWL